jgi:hypothetical protein
MELSDDYHPNNFSLNFVNVDSGRFFVKMSASCSSYMLNLYLFVVYVFSKMVIFRVNVFRSGA